MNSNATKMEELRPLQEKARIHIAVHQFRKMDVAKVLGRSNTHLNRVLSGKLGYFGGKALLERILEITPEVIAEAKNKEVCVK